MNEIDPALLQQAQLLGGRRTPTRAEQKEMERANIMMAHLQVSGTALSSLVEAGGSSSLKSVRFAQSIAESILRKSEGTKDDFDGNVQLRKIRNQLAAQLIYSHLRGSKTHGDSDEIVTGFFDIAATLVSDAKDFAEKEVNSEKAGNPSSIIATP